eukprot:scaffold92801_cov19-Tisochrysis_lutea.AAC.1
MNERGEHEGMGGKHGHEKKHLRWHYDAWSWSGGEGMISRCRLTCQKKEAVFALLVMPCPLHAVSFNTIFTPSKLLLLLLAGVPPGCAGTPAREPCRERGGY